MVYLKIYRKGLIIVKKMKQVKYKLFDTKKFRKTEFIIALVIGIIFLVMLGFAVCNKVFIPVTLVTFSMLLFSICYYYIEDKNKNILVYFLFGVGVIIIVIEVIYTLVNIL